MEHRSGTFPIAARDTAAVLFLDLQAEIVKNNQTISDARLRHAAGALAKLAALHDLPAFLSAVPPGGEYLVEVTGALAASAPRMRLQTSAFADHGLVAALQQSGRRTLILAGVASEIVVQRTALDARAAGYDVLVAVDACGGIDARTEAAAWRRITAAGAATTSVITIAAELAGDFTTDLGGATLGIVYEAIAAASA